MYDRKKTQIGDISWEIIDKSTVDKLLSYEEIQKYMSLSPEEELEHLQNVRLKPKILHNL